MEDRSQDAELMVYELRRAGFDVTWQRVDTEADYREALETSIDAILADYNLPQMEAPRALELLQQRELDIPFIVVSGTVGEEVAVAMMKSGAHDYVMKGNLSRLGPALRRELREADERRQRRRAEQLLQQSEERYRRLAENAQDAIFRRRMTPTPIVEYVSPAIAEITGYTPEEYYADPELSFKLVHPEDQDLLAEVRSGSAAILKHNVVMRWIHKDGRTVWTEQRYTPVYDQTGALVAVEGIARDITERKQTQDELMALYNATSYLFKADSLLNLGHQIVEAVVNEFQQANCGLFLIEKTWNRLIPVAHTGDYRSEPETPLDLDGPGLIPLAARTRRIVYAPDVATHPFYVIGDTLTRSELVVPLSTGNGTIAVLDLQSPSLAAFNGSDQRVLRAFAERAAAAIEIMRLYDRINRHAAELEWQVEQRTEELRRSKEHVETILNHSVDAIFLVDAGGLIAQANPAGYDMFDLNGDIWHEALKGFLEPSSAEDFEAALAKVVETLAPARVELTAVHADGVAFDVDAVLAPLEAEDADELRIICSLRDITQRKQLEAELRKALAQERELNELKSRFVSMVSHDFRTPLATILSSTDLLLGYRDRLSEEKQARYFESIRLQVKHLTDLLDDVLIIGRADTKGLDFRPEPVNFQTFCEDIIEEMRLSAPEHDIRLGTEGQCAQVALDPKLMRQALHNLLSNAIKYSPEGGEIALALTCAPDTVTLRVSDQGIGIPEADLPYLFEGFHRGKNVGEIQGTGLGLPIVQRVVEAHGGTIAIDSEVDAGTTFTLTLPLA